MWRRQSNILRIIFALGCLKSEGYTAPQQKYSGTAALQLTRQCVAFGERPSNSPAIERLRGFIEKTLKPLGGQLERDTFQGQTPNGPVPMVNIILHFPGTSGRSIVVSGHYDTKRIPMMKFVGANDGGSSTGFLLELARMAAASKHTDDLYLVFFDGEEAIGPWSQTDSKYGSRHLADKWLAEGKLSAIRALINVDMIGDKNLDLYNDANSSDSLRKRVQLIAARLGYARYFSADAPGGMDDDHLPFVAAGVSSIDLIDFDFGPDNSYWHKETDTADKLGAQSFQVVGDIVVKLITELEISGH